MKKISPALIRQLFTLLLIVFFGVLIFNEVAPYLGGILGAITLYVLFKNWMRKLVHKGWNRSLAAFSLIVFSFVVILLPIAGIISLLGSKVGQAVNNSTRLVAAVKQQINHINQVYNIDILSQINADKVTAWVSESVQALAGNTFTIVISIGVMYFVFYYMLMYRNRLDKVVAAYIPIDDDNLSLIGKESTSMVKANAIGIPLVALCQGIIALIGFWIFDVPDPFFWFVITTIGSMIPFIGTLLGVVPVFLLLLAYGDTTQAIGILIYGLVVVGSTDNIIRLFVLKRLDDVHPLITLFGVIVGVPLFGFIGLIFGPLLISLFILIIKIYKKEYGDSNYKRTAVMRRNEAAKREGKEIDL